MDKRKYNSAVINASYKAKVWMWFSIVMLISNIGLAYFVINADTSEKTIIVPPNMNAEFSVNGNDVSDSYLEQMARYFSQQLLTYHKLNAKAQFDLVLRHTDPSVFGAMQTRFDLDDQRIRKNNISSVFHPMKMHIREMTVYLAGEQMGMVGTRVVNNLQKTYAFEFANAYTGLRLTGFNEVIRNQIGEYTVVPHEQQYMMESSFLQGGV